LNSMNIAKWATGCLMLATLASAPVAMADMQPPTPEMQRALAKAAEGPVTLRRYIQRTQGIYMFDFNEVMARLHPEAMASTDNRVALVQGTGPQ
jgi:hypothetical protein